MFEINLNYTYSTSFFIVYYLFIYDCVLKGLWIVPLRVAAGLTAWSASSVTSKATLIAQSLVIFASRAAR